MDCSDSGLNEGSFVTEREARNETGGKEGRAKVLIAAIAPAEPGHFAYPWILKSWQSWRISVF